MANYISYDAPLMAHLLTFTQTETATPQSEPAKTDGTVTPSISPTDNKPVENKATDKVTSEKTAPGAQLVEPKKGQPVQPPPPTFFEVLQSMAPMMLMIFAVYYFMIARPEQEERKKRQSTFEGMKKNDYVVTHGGIYGTIHDISSDGNEVILKLEENAKLRIRKSSIESVIKPPAK
jgi:preprotein translocase subunit YajC